LLGCLLAARKAVVSEQRAARCIVALGDPVISGDERSIRTSHHRCPALRNTRRRSATKAGEQNRLGPVERTLTLGNRGQVKRRVHAHTHARTHVRPSPRAPRPSPPPPPPPSPSSLSLPPPPTHPTPTPPEAQHFSHCFLLRQLFFPLFSPYRDSPGSRAALIR
jgi:hypothetical protein